LGVAEFPDRRSSETTTISRQRARAMTNGSAFTRSSLGLTIAVCAASHDLADQLLLLFVEIDNSSVSAAQVASADQILDPHPLSML
jgi:hypothetical protein